MFEDRIVTIHLADIIFLFAGGYLAGFIVSVIYPYDKNLAMFLLIPAIVSWVAYFWKFLITSVKKEGTSIDADCNSNRIIDSSKANLKSNFKVKIPVKKFYEA